MEKRALIRSESGKISLEKVRNWHWLLLNSTKNRKICNGCGVLVLLVTEIVANGFSRMTSLDTTHDSIVSAWFSTNASGIVDASGESFMNSQIRLDFFRRRPFIRSGVGEIPEDIFHLKLLIIKLKDYFRKISKKSYLVKIYFGKFLFCKIIIFHTFTDIYLRLWMRNTYVNSSFPPHCWLSTNRIGEWVAL